MLDFENFNSPALHADEKTFIAELADFTNGSDNRREASCGVLSCIKALHFFALKQSPCAWRRVAPPDQVINMVNVIGPVDSRLSTAAPTLVACLLLVLDPLHVLA